MLPVKPSNTPFLSGITDWLSCTRIHSSTLNPYETSTILTCSPVLAGKGRRHAHSSLKLHAGLVKTPVQFRQGGRTQLPAEVKQRLPATCLFSISVLEQLPPKVLQIPQSLASTHSFSFLPTPDAKSGNKAGPQF